MKEFCYLRSLKTDRNKAVKELRIQIALAKQAFEKNRSLLTNKYLSIISKNKFNKNIHLEYPIQRL